MEEVHHVYGRKDDSHEHLRPLCYLCHAVAPCGDAYWEWEKSGASGPEQAAARMQSEAYYSPEFSSLINPAINIFVQMRSMERRAVTKELTRAVLQAKKRRGERTGTVPYGFRVGEDGKLVADGAEQAVIAEIRGLRERGVSFREIAAALNGQGATTRRGTPWRFQYVANVLEVK